MRLHFQRCQMGGEGGKGGNSALSCLFSFFLSFFLSAMIIEYL